MPRTIGLLPSPLLAAVAWEPVAEALRVMGWRATVVGLPRGLRDPDDVMRGFLSGLPRDDVALVPHSNAGLYAPALADAIGPVATVFVDAALPMSAGATRLAPPQFFEFLTGLADDEGLLPPWTEWWGEADLERLLPDPYWRRRVEAEEIRLPLSYFRSTVQVPSGWADNRCGYLAFGDTYAEEVDLARHHEWPVAMLGGGHLHMLHDPAGVANGIIELLDQLESG